MKLGMNAISLNMPELLNFRINIVNNGDLSNVEDKSGSWW
jgi:hypothetical protein